MLYVPSQFNNSNFRYSLNDYYITVRTNQNCYTQYSTTYCDCYNIYPEQDYSYTYAYACNYNSSYNIDYSLISSDWVNRVDSTNVFIISGLIFTLIFVFVYKPVARLFGRWLKC